MGEGISIPNIKCFDVQDVFDDGTLFLYKYTFSKFGTPLMINGSKHHQIMIDEMVDQFRQTLERYILEEQTQSLINKISK